MGRMRKRGLSPFHCPGDLLNPLELGKGHGIVGDADFVDAIRGRYLSRGADTREIQAVRTPAVRPEPERIIEAVCAETGVSREAVLRKGSRGGGRGLLMEMLYRYGELSQREIGAMLGIDYSAVSIGRKRFLGMMEADPELTALFTRAQTRISQG